MAQNNSIFNSIQECLAGKESKDSIFPFLWVHGETHSRLKEEIDAIFNCGLREFCVESRTHEKFCEDQWWDDFSFILEYAQSKDMKVWLLDDKHFPTGYANAAIEKKYPHLRKKCVRIACVDMAGPMKDASVILPAIDSTEQIISVVAYRRNADGDDVDGASGVLLTPNVQNGLVYWDIPEGVWRIFYIIRTERWPARFKYYIDMCDAESCRVMVKEIYGPHYERYKQYFGNTFRGFFSDEPCFSNNIGSFVDSLGTPSLSLPWREDMLSLLAQQLDMDTTGAELLLPALWFTVTGKTSAIRLRYMDIITKLYRDNFSRMLGDWCREHNVLYIGHVIEDAGAHTRLGYGSGHFFRAMEGQDMSGMDIVLNQISPGITGVQHTYSSGPARRANPDFYHYTLNHLATSAAHLDPVKQDRVMCEIYGAFGWAEGVPTMKYFTDFMLVGGVNHFVPHAFSAKTEDPDCPPHFYNGGLNSQYPAFKKLMDYMGRMCHILRSGKTRVDVAVYYNAESEWCGGGYMQLPEIASKLGRAHVEFDFVPMDYLMEAEATREKLQVYQCEYKALLIPGAEILPQAMCHKLEAIFSQGIRVIYVGEKPCKTENGNPVQLPGEVVELCDLPPVMESLGLRSVTLSEDFPTLHVLHMQDAEDDLYFFFNPEKATAVDTHVFLDGSPAVQVYDGWHNRVYGLKGENGSYPLQLQPGGSTLWCVQKQGDVLPEKDIYEWKTLSTGPVQVTLTENGNIVFQEELASEKELKNYARDFSRFGGIIRYEFECEKDMKAIRFGCVGEISGLWIDDIEMGMEIDAPHAFDITVAGAAEKHKIVVEVIVNQGYSRRDHHSEYLAMPPMGIFGPVEYVER